ncbi:hypothetical protein SEMRO_1597_G284900.1 [Seminavis robusta]|uniref:Uncharacterized protein n=1 Tax=Seminavis robusta TaxID=568900 RepID=A0A9N8EPF9_9STRA|nr:hypothetical protein SEMRO_1597_G284900.1 [Seminavis robusta]|eukprot:Sro1597_g284900.1 n/a (483) ;mRNA; r:20763-22544
MDDEQEQGEEDQPQKKRPKLQLDTLVKAIEIKPFKVKGDAPGFICQRDWVENAKHEIEVQMALTDKLRRVAPLAISRCSRGGKTRALYEIADMNFVYKQRPFKVIFATFSDFSEIEPHEYEDPVQALLIRIAFVALKDRPDEPEPDDFLDFCKRREYVPEADIEKWLGDTPALLILDELNNLTPLSSETKSKSVTQFARFIKGNFITPRGCFFVFSSHVVSTLQKFGNYLDPSEASERDVILQELPLIDNLRDARNLKANLTGAREAVYYGLMPGLLYDQSNKSVKAAGVKKNTAMTKLNTESSPGTQSSAFLAVLRSLIDGNLRGMPSLLHALIDASHTDGEIRKIRWAPYHLRFVFQELDLEGDYSELKSSMAELCHQVLTSKAASGDAWECLFVLFLIARKNITRVYGYQCKEGKHNAAQGTDSDISLSYVMKGLAPQTEATRKGWVISGETDIQEFYGISGMHWTPNKWRELLETDQS